MRAGLRRRPHAPCERACPGRDDHRAKQRNTRVLTRQRVLEGDFRAPGPAAVAFRGPATSGYDLYPMAGPSPAVAREGTRFFKERAEPMAIQFRCPGCEQPIEVDDEYAGQTAACPYCRRVVTVPVESTLGSEGSAPARPAEAEPAPPASPVAGERATPAVTPPPLPPQGPCGEGLHVGPCGPTPRERAARTYGNYALICTVLLVLLFGAIVGYSAIQMAQEVMKHPGSQPSPERVQEIQQELTRNGLVIAANIGTIFFGLAGLVLSIVSLTQGRQGNWRAILSLVICGLAVLCICGGSVVTAAGLAAG